MKAKYLFVLSMMICWLTATAQELKPLKQNLTFTLDNLGDGHLEMSMHFEAAQWDNFKKNVGSNQDILKRGMERALPAYYLQNFVYKEDAMDRSYTLSFDALGLAKINDNGLWEIDPDLKNPDITKISDRNYALTATYNSQGALVEQLIKLNIPEGASDIKQDKNAFGKAIFTYSLTPGRSKSSLLFLIAGIVLLLSAAGLYFRPDLLTRLKLAMNQRGGKAGIRFDPVAAQKAHPRKKAVKQPAK